MRQTPIRLLTFLSSGDRHNSSTNIFNAIKCKQAYSFKLKILNVVEIKCILERKEYKCSHKRNKPKSS